MTTPEKGLSEGKSNRTRNPDPVEAELVSGGDDLEVVLDGRGIERVTDLAIRAVGPQPVPDGTVSVVVVEEGGILETIDLRYDQTYSPTRKAGTVTLGDVESFAAYVDRHRTDHTEVYCGLRANGTGDIVAVLNAGGMSDRGDDFAGTYEGAAGYGDHRAQLALTPSPEWTLWTKNDRSYLTQTDFAELLEDRLVDIVEPDGADLLEVATTLEATTKADFRSSVRLRDGQRQLEYVETIDAKAGQKGSLTIPEKFVLALRPFLGSDRYRVTVRLRFRLVGEKLTIGYVLDRPADLLEGAFGDVVAAIRDKVEVPVFGGFSAPPRPQA